MEQPTPERPQRRPQSSRILTLHDDAPTQEPQPQEPVVRRAQSSRIFAIHEDD